MAVFLINHWGGKHVVYATDEHGECTNKNAGLTTKRPGLN